jgi:thioesterase domain-containing protein
VTLQEIEVEITKYMPLEEFLRIQERLAFLRKEEENKLSALAELQKAYLAANTDHQQEMVKNTVGQIRELSRKTREEIRSLNSVIFQRMPLQLAKELYDNYLEAARAGHNPK